MNMTPTIAVHMTAAIAALTLGPVALWARKGKQQRPKLHRAFGYAWVTLMILTAVTAIFIRDFRLPNIEGCTPIHLLVPWVFFCLTVAFARLRKGKLLEHGRMMNRLYWGACVGAGLLTLVPGRYLGNLVWGTQGNTSTAPKPLLAMLTPIVSRTPSWVWVLLAVLVGLSLMQARTRVLGLNRLIVVPLVMVVLSLLGTVSAAGLSFTTLLAWLLGYAALTLALSRTPLAAGLYEPLTQRYTVVGSYWPLAVMLAIFMTKFAVGVLTATNAAMVHDTLFPIAVSLLYGAFSGFFAGRVLRLVKLAKLDAASLFKRALKPLFKTIAIAATVMTVVIAGALLLGGPKSMAQMASVNKPFATLDYTGLPAPSTFTARDGAALTYLHYPAKTALKPAQRVVLVHGSSANARSMHALAMGLAASGVAVDALDMRGHGASGERGHIAYIGQLEDDVADFMKASPLQGRNTLMGFSSGGGFVLRFAGGSQQGLFSDYILLSPYLHYEAPTAKPHNGGWVSIGIPRLVALQALNAIGITVLNHLWVTQFALDERAKTFLTPAYDFALAANFGPHLEYTKDIAQAKGAMRIVAGVDDELFDTRQFANVFAKAGKAVDVTLVPGINHIGLITQAAAIEAVVNACKQGGN